MRVVRVPVVLAGLILLASCGTGTESPSLTDDEQPLQEVEYPVDDWKTAPVPDVVGGEAELMSVSDPWFTGGAPDPGVMSVLVTHAGRVIFERNAPDARTDTPVPSWSVAKSVLGAAVGVAVEKGIISLDDASLNPAWPAGDPRSRITVAQLLHMASGLEFNESWDPGEDAARLLTHPAGAAAYAATKPLLSAPGTRFNYSSGDSALLAAHLSRRLGGEKLLESFVRDNVLAPIGVTKVSFDLDAAGDWPGAVGLNMSARDYARFGLLFVRDGSWAGTQVIPSSWAEYSRTVGVAGSSYGAHWWMQTYPVFSADGLYGQLIVVDPSTTTVVVVTSRTGADFSSGAQLALRLTGTMSLTIAT